MLCLWGVLLLLLTLTATPSFGRKCVTLDATTVPFAGSASCEGTDRSSAEEAFCERVVPFGLPDGLSAAPLRPKLITLEFLASETGHYGPGLTVVHGPGLDETGHKREVGPSEPHYSINTSIVDVEEGSVQLQVQLLYGNNSNSFATPTPGWPDAPRSRRIYPGGRDVKLEVVFCEIDPDHFDRQASGPLPIKLGMYELTG